MNGLVTAGDLLKTRGGVFAMQIVYLVGLGVLAVLYFNGVWIHRETLGTIPVAVPWWGALGAVMLSLSGIFSHRLDWKASEAYWHWSRPLIGVVMGSFAVLVFQAGVLAVGKDLKPPAGVGAAQNLFYYVLAFIIGYREQTTRALIERVADVVIGPGESATPAAGPAVPTSITKIAPRTGPGGTEVRVTGTGLDNIEGVIFGDTEVAFGIDSETELTVTAPDHDPGIVPMVFALHDGKPIRRKFTYT